MSAFLLLGVAWSTIGIAGAAFISIMAVGWLAADFLGGNSTRSENRLDQLRGQNVKSAAAATSTKDKMAALLGSASPAMSDAIKPKNEKELGKLRDKLNSANLRSEGAVQLFYSAKVLLVGVFLFLGGIGGIVTYGFDAMSMVVLVVMGMIGWMLPDLYVGLKDKGRKQEIFLGLPDALDLLVVCVEAGLGLDQGMRRVADEMRKSHKTIAAEFELCNTQLQMGSTREVVLTDLGERNGVEDLKTLSSVIIQVDKFGTSVGKALRTQSDAMRVRRRQIAEEKAAKTAVQLIFPLVLFIFPGIFVVLVGPAAIKVANDFLTL